MKNRILPAEEVNRRLVEQYTEIAALAGGLAHEIKNPLSTIRLNMELLAEDFDGAESPRERRALQKIEVVQRECQRLAEPARQLPQLRQDPLAAARTIGPEPGDQARARLLPPQGRSGRHRSDLLSGPGPAQRGAGPRKLSWGPDQPGAQRPAGHAQRRPTGGSHQANGRLASPWT